MTFWPWWTDDETETLIALCREDGIEASAGLIVDAAENYMSHGTDGGGNQWGIVGTVIALNVDRIARARWNRKRAES